MAGTSEESSAASPHAPMKSKETRSRPKPPSCGKLKTKGIKVVGKWKQVKIDPNVFADGQMDDLVCFEELTDYRLVSPAKNPSSLFSKEEPKKRKAQAVSEGEEQGESSSPKKKRSKDVEARGTSAQKEFEVKDAELGPQEGSSRCPELEIEKTTSHTVTKKKKKKGKKKNSPSQGTTPKVPKKVKTWMPEMHDQKADVSAWKGLFVPKPVLRALSFLGFSAPTPIQALALAPAIRDRLDVLGAAETGSGKTLAFAIPMIHTVLEWHKRKSAPAPSNAGKPPGEARAETGSPGKAGTESGMMPDETGVESEAASTGVGAEAGASPHKVRAKMQPTPSDQVALFCDDDDAGEGPSSLTKKPVSKQDEDEEENLSEEQTGKFHKETNGRIATCKEHSKRPLLGLVLTPTRELAIQVKQHVDAVARFTGIKTAILVGGMSAQKQQRMLNRQPEMVIATPGRLWELIKEKHPHLSNLRQLRCLVVDEADRMIEKGHFAELSQLMEMLSESQYNPERQTLVFSATLTLVHQAPARILHKKHTKKIDKTAKLGVLVQKIGLRARPKIIDLTRREATVETLMETKIHCETEEKDLYLYYFLMQHPGRTLVFANSISCIKRLSGLLKVLDIMPLTLHACMHQKQRLRNLEQFAHLRDCVLLATDVAARGLDIPEVQHVIHYQVPRTSEVYVHRSGRTARATNEGLSLLLIGPEDVINFKKIYKTLKKDEDIPLFPVETKYMDAVKERIRLARLIEKAEYQNFQACLHNSWIEKIAADLEIELEEGMYKGGKADEQQERRRQKQMKVFKKELRHLLSQPLFRDDLKTKYPTQSGRLPMVVSAPRNGESALSCVSKQKKKKQQHKRKEQPQGQPQPSTSAG